MHRGSRLVVAAGCNAIPSLIVLMLHERNPFSLASVPNQCPMSPVEAYARIEQ
ncbi:MAG: hypothetical protein NZX77_21435 [Polyangiaceae bacterium]|nr:hypothetical protein [Polyangiaceae bacterium]